MSIKKITAIFLSLLLILCLVPAAVFAEAPSEVEEQDYEIYGWYDYGEEDVVRSVTLGGKDLAPFGAGVESMYAAPGTKLSVEVSLEEGYELGILEENGYFFWMIGEAQDWVLAGKTLNEVTVPDASYLEKNSLITLCFLSVSSEIPEYFSIIDSVTINAPKIKVGDGWTMVTHTVDVGEGVTDSYTRAEPAPAVTVPDGAAYALSYYYDENNNIVEEAYWALKDENGFYKPDEDRIFEAGEEYYIDFYLYAKDVESEELDTYRLFCINRPPKITVNNGELVDYQVLYVGPRGEQSRMSTYDFSPYMEILIKVTVPEAEESAPTSDMNPTPWVWTMILTLSAVLTAVYYEIEDIRRAYSK